MLTRLPAWRIPSVVTSRVWGINATLKRSETTSTTVRLTPSTATEPLGTSPMASEPGTWNHIVTHSPSRVTSITSAVSSMCPWTKCPPSRPPAANGRSRLTGSPGARSPRLVRARVSVPASNDSVDGPMNTTVRQQPLIATLSPMAESTTHSEPTSTSSRRAGGSSTSSTTDPRASTRPVNMERTCQISVDLWRRRDRIAWKNDRIGGANAYQQRIRGIAISCCQ